MKRLLAIVLAILMIITGSASGQAKVGSTGAAFLNLPYSLRASAMGQVATVFLDRQAYAGNPGSIGLLATRPELSFGPLEWRKDINHGKSDFYGSGTVLPVNGVRRLLGEKATLGLAAYTTWLNSEPLITDGYTLIGPSVKWTDHTYHMLAGLGINGRIQLGLGAGFTYYRESTHWSDGSLDMSVDGWATDFGLMARLPIELRYSDVATSPNVVLTPSVGASLTNSGPHMSYSETRSYPLARNIRTGIGSELAVFDRHVFGGWQILSTAGAIEYQKVLYRDGFIKYGAELDLAEALALRIGHMDEYDGTNTWGFAIRSSGLTRLLLWALRDPTQLSPTSEFFASKLTVEYAQSHTTPSGAEKAQILRGFTLTFRYGN